MKRKIVNIDREKCNGCGACANACHEGAIVMDDGKAKLVRDDYCDGFGDCLPACPTGAITITEREAAAYDKEAVAAAKDGTSRPDGLHTPPPGGCPGKKIMMLKRQSAAAPAANDESQMTNNAAEPQSQLAQWPVQIQLVPVNAPYLAGAKLLIAADCTAYAYAAFHEKFMSGRVTIIGCPKLDPMDYSEKLTRILNENDIKSVTIVRMEVPCCGGLERAAENALKTCGKLIPWRVVTISLDGRIIDDV